MPDTWTTITRDTNEEAYTAYLHLWRHVRLYTAPLDSEGIAVEAGGVGDLTIIRLSDVTYGTTFYVSSKAGCDSEIQAKAREVFDHAVTMAEEDESLDAETIKRRNDAIAKRREIDAYNRSARQHRAYAEHMADVQGDADKRYMHGAYLPEVQGGTK